MAVCYKKTLLGSDFSTPKRTATHKAGFFTIVILFFLVAFLAGQSFVPRVQADASGPSLTPLAPVPCTSPQTGLVMGGYLNSAGAPSVWIVSVSGVSENRSHWPSFFDANSSMWYWLKLVVGTIYNGVWTYDGNVSVSYTPPGHPNGASFTPIVWDGNAVGYHQIMFGCQDLTGNQSWVSVGYRITFAHAIAEAQQELTVCYQAVANASSAGANVAGLLRVLDQAGENLSQADLAYGIGDNASALIYANQCLNLLIQNNVQTRANALESSASQARFWGFMINVVGSSAGAVAVVICGFVVWTFLKRRYLRRGGVAR